MSSAPNLLFVCIDSLREDFTRRDAVDAPHLHRYITEGTSFREMHATTTSPIPAVASVLTGTYPERNGVGSGQSEGLDRAVDSIAEVFSDAGFETAAAVREPLPGDSGIEREFDHFWTHSDSDGSVGDWSTDALERLRSLSEPFFLFVHIDDLRGDLESPDGFDAPQYGGTEYGRAFSALDRELGSLVEATPDDTLLALLGTHGRSLPWPNGTHRLLGKVLGALFGPDPASGRSGVGTRIDSLMHGSGPTERDRFLDTGHGSLVTDAATNVPFVLWGPGIEEATVTTQVRQVDVFPTVLEYYDLAVPEGVHGESLFPADSLHERVVYVRAGDDVPADGEVRAVRAEGYKYVDRPRGDSELYDLEADSAELADVAEENPGVVSRMRERIPDDEWLRSGSTSEEFERTKLI